MPLDCSRLSPRELDDLFGRLHDAADAHNDLVELSRWFPSPALLRLITLLARLKEAIDKIPLEFWLNLIRFINCDLEAIRDASKDDLLKLLDLIELHIQIEQENPSIPLPDGHLLGALEEIRRARETMESANQAQALEEIQRLKVLLRLEYAALWSLLVSMYNLGLLDDLGQAGGDLLKPRVGAAIKGLLRRIITRILEKKLPQQTAGKVIPYVGVILTAAEVLAFGGVLSQISDLRVEICKLLCSIVRELAARGMRWPLEHPNIVIIPDKLITGEYPLWEVTVQNFIRCSYQESPEDDCEWGEPCLIPFADGSVRKTFVVKHPIALFKGPDGDFDGQTLSYPNDIDQDAVDNCSCLQPRPDGATPIKCYTFTRLQALGQGYDPDSPLGLKFTFGPTLDIINGVVIL